MTYERDETGVPYAQKINVSPVMDDTLRRQELVGNSLTRIAGARTMGIPTEDFNLDNVQYDTRGIDTSQFSPLGDIRGEMPYDPRQMKPNLTNFNTSNLPSDPRNFDTSQFEDFNGKANSGPNNPNSFNVNSQFKDFGDQRSAAPYDPRSQNVNIENYTDQRGEMPYDPRSYEDLNAYGNDVQDAYMAQQRRNLDPAFEQQMRAQIQNLADRGLPIDGEAYKTAMSNINREQSNAYQNASNQAILAGGSEAQRRLEMERGIRSDAMGESISTNNQINQSEQTRLAAEAGLRSQAWNEETQQYGLNQQAAQSRLGAGTQLREQSWNEQMQQNQLNNQNVQQELDAQSKIRSGALQEDVLVNNQQNQIAQQNLASQMGLRSAALGEAQSMHAQDFSDAQQKLQIEQNIRQQQIQEQLMLRNQNANEVASLLGSAPNMPVPQANAMPQYNLQAPDVIGAHMGAYNAAMSGYNAQQQQAGSAWQGAANIATGLGGMAMKSSKAYKHDDGDPGSIISKLNEVPIRSWRYNRNIDPREEIHIGPYAEDWKRVLGFGNGKEIMAVDAIGVALKCLQELHAEVEELREQVASLKKRRK